MTEKPVMPEYHTPFLSALSVNQHLRVNAFDLEPMGVVTGTSVYHIGWQAPAWTRAGELETLTQALSEARASAMRRLIASAQKIGADGVVGIQFTTTPNERGRRLTEFIATGTAVRSRKENMKLPDGQPFTSSLSGQDLALLLQAGYAPCSLALGVCVYHAGYQNAETWLNQIGRNLEMPTFTEALLSARSLALGRMEEQARQSGAHGILGVDLIEHSHEWGSHVVECFVSGSAVLAPDTLRPLGEPVFYLSLSDPPAPVIEEPPPPPSESVEVSVDAG